MILNPPRPQLFPYTTLFRSQVGTTISGGFNMGSLWSGTAASWINLTPAAATQSEGFGVHGGQQVGRALIGGQNHAALWTGSAASFADLNPSPSVTSTAYGVHN